MTTPQMESQGIVQAAVRAAILEAGWHPDTRSGQSLYEWGMDQVAEGQRVPAVRDIYRRGQTLGLPVEAPASDPADIETQIAEARAAGDWDTASKLQTAIDRVRNQAERNLPTDADLRAIADAREAAETAQREAANATTETERMEAQKRSAALWAEASRLQLASERRMKGNDQPPEPYPVQPTGGLNPEQLALLEDESTPIDERIEQARQTGQFVVASLLENRREQNVAATARR